MEEHKTDAQGHPVFPLPTPSGPLCQAVPPRDRDYRTGPRSLDPSLGRIIEHLGLKPNQIANIRAEWEAAIGLVQIHWDGHARLTFDKFRELVAGPPEGAVADDAQDREVLSDHFVMTKRRSDSNAEGGDE